MEPHALDGFEDGRVRPAEEAGERLHGGFGVGVGRGDADGHFEDGAGAGAEEDGAADFADEGGHVAGVVEREGLGVEAVFVAEGEVVEEVFDGVDAALGEAGGDALADALDEVDGGGEVERHGFDGSSGGSATEVRRSASAEEDRNGAKSKQQIPKGNDRKKSKGNKGTSRQAGGQRKANTGILRFALG